MNIEEDRCKFVSSKLSKKLWKTPEICKNEVDLSGQTIVVEVVRKFQIEHLILHIVFMCGAHWRRRPVSTIQKSKSALCRYPQCYRPLLALRVIVKRECPKPKWKVNVNLPNSSGYFDLHIKLIRPPKCLCSVLAYISRQQDCH